MITFDPITRRFIYGLRPCQACSHGHEHWRQAKGRRVAWHGKPCDKCKGTGRRGSGRCRACNRDDYMAREYGAGNVRDYDRPYDNGPCDTCQGTGDQPATRYDYVPSETAQMIMDTIGDDRIRILADPNGQTAMERLLGVLTFDPGKQDMTNFWGIMDYGRTWETLRKAAQTDSQARALGTEDCGNLRAEIDTFKATIRNGVIASTSQGVAWCLEDGRIIDTIVVRVTQGGYTIMGFVHPTT